MSHKSTSNSSSIYKPGVYPHQPMTLYSPNTFQPRLSPSGLSSSLDRTPLRRSVASVRVALALSAFIKLLESLFWLSLLLEATHNEEDHSGLPLTLTLASAFGVSLVTGLVSLFGPCFHGLFLLRATLVTTLASLVLNCVVLIITFTLDYYQYQVNKDNQAETAFNATIGIITCGAIFATTKKLMREVKKKRKIWWTRINAHKLSQGSNPIKTQRLV